MKLHYIVKLRVPADQLPSLLASAKSALISCELDRDTAPAKGAVTRVRGPQKKERVPGVTVESTVLDFIKAAKRGRTQEEISKHLESVEYSPNSASPAISTLKKNGTIFEHKGKWKIDDEDAQ